MTPQEIFDTVAKHLFKQGCRSMELDDDQDSACLYRGPEGRMCAVGVLIPDELYNTDMEFQNAAYLVEKVGSPFPEWMKANANLLRSLQISHDRPHHWLNSEAMRERLRAVADHYDLSSAVLNGLSFAWEGTVMQPDRKEGPVYWVPRFKRGALGWVYVRWGRKLWRIW